ncbi:MAG: ABC transporter ATP-binding protein [Tissierellia bacterium]|nr:ABC transporter ATP-binding protein [Tissierellia bacterium]
MTIMIEMNNIKKEFKGKLALEDVNFSVERGEIFGLLGPSGAGKTTIIKILTGQLKGNGGSANLFGVPSNSLTSDEYKKIGTVLDESGIYRRLSIYDNMKIFADIYGIDKNEIKPILDRVGLGDSLKVSAEKLSKGMLQRLVFARAILNKPMVLFLDEPTSGLDPSTVRSIHELIFEQRDRGCTIFLTTHNMEEASKLCDIVALLDNGNIVECDEPKKLCLKYNKKNSIEIRLKNGDNVEINNIPEMADILCNYLKDGEVETIHSNEPNLENVFIELTGRALS